MHVLMTLDLHRCLAPCMSRHVSTVFGTAAGKMEQQRFECLSQIKKAIKYSPRQSDLGSLECVQLWPVLKTGIGNASNLDYRYTDPPEQGADGVGSHEHLSRFEANWKPDVGVELTTIILCSTDSNILNEFNLKPIIWGFTFLPQGVKKILYFIIF